MSHEHKLPPTVGPVTVEIPRPGQAITAKFVPGDLVWLMVNNKAVIKKVTTVTIRLVPFPGSGYDIRIDLLLDAKTDWEKSEVASVRSDENYCFHTKADLLTSL